MDHQSFRFYIPGIIFLTPIYIVLCHIAIQVNTDAEIRSFILLGGIATFPAIALPIGWWIYNAYRVWWLFWTKGYENKDFVKLICRDTKPYYCPVSQTININLTHIKGIGSWIKIPPELFRKTFYPLTSVKSFKKEIKKNGIQPKFAEPLSDFLLWKDSGYEYARSISTVRYGLESTVFALLTGLIYAFGLKYIWLFQLNRASNSLKLWIWITVLIFLTIVMILTLIKRWHDASKEYDARLILTTLTSMDSNFFSPKIFNSNIPDSLLTELEKIQITGKEIAAFDLDNTLLIDDIGEAVFAHLLKKNLIKNYSWEKYQADLSTNRASAYKKVISVLNGLFIEEVKTATYEVIKSEDRHIEIDGFRIGIPVVNPIMQSLIFYLRSKGIDIYVVTASNSISAEIICWKYFGIPSNKVIAAPVQTRNKRVFFDPESEIPYNEGKVLLLKKKTGIKPFITGGDGPWDIPLLDYTSAEGIRLWLGKEEHFQNIKETKFPDKTFIRPS